MKKNLLLICLVFFVSVFTCISAPLRGNEDLLKLFHLAVESGDTKLINEVIEALLQMESNNKNLLEALSKYCEKGKMEFALHRAIKDKNLLASVILTHHAKDVNSRLNDGSQVVWKVSISIGSDLKTPLELALDANLVEIIPYLLMKKADPHVMRRFNFLYENIEDYAHMKELGYNVQKFSCAKTNRTFAAFDNILGQLQRSFIGALIANDRLDILKVMKNLKSTFINWNMACFTENGRNYSPLQFALATKRYEIAQFLIDIGVRIE